MDVTDFITLTKVVVFIFGALYAKSNGWSFSGTAVMLGTFMLVCFLWGFESVMPYDSDPWGQFVAAGMPAELFQRGAVGGLFGCAAITMLIMLNIKLFADGGDDERKQGRRVSDVSGRKSNLES